MSIFGKDLIDFLNDLLAYAQLDNDFGRILFSLVIMLVVTGFLAFAKGSGHLILLINIILFILFAAIGFFPTWTILVIALILTVIIFTQFGGGGSD